MKRILIFLMSVCLPALALAAAPPNILVIVADDLGYGELGCQGFTTDIPTPHIDSLARHGVRFTSSYVTAPFCAASRAALLTGRSQTRFGFEFNPIGARNAEPGIGLPLGERTLADALRDAGYATALVGKWHLGGTAPFHPQRRGFDEFFGFLHEGHYYAPPPWAGHVTWLRRKTLPDGSQGRWTSPDGRLVWSTALGSFEPAYDADNPILRGSQPVAERANLTDAFTREAEDFIARHKARPFFLLLTYNAPHSPLQATDAHLAKFAGIADLQRRIFAAMVAQLDDGVGRVLARLRAEGLEENTLIFFLSDNGGPTRELTSRNGPLRGEKGQLFEGGLRVPFLAQWKGRLPAGRVEPRLISALDIFPTALAAAGVDAKPATKLEGVDLIPFLSGRNAAEPHEFLAWRYAQQAAIRVGDWKLVRAGGGARGRSGARDPAATLAGAELFNLATDIGETKNLAAAEPERVKQLEAAWNRWNADNIPPAWTPTSKAP